MGAVNITLGQGNLGGVVQTADGVCGLVMTGTTEGGGYTAGTPILVTSMADVATAGITVGNNPFAIKQLQEFYNQAGNGANLYVMLVPNTMTVASMADNTNANGAKRLLDYAAGAIKVLGLISDDTLVTVGTVTAALNPAVYTAASNVKVMVAAYATAMMPFRAIIGGTSYTGVPANLTNEATGTTNNAAAIVIGDTDVTYSNKGAAVGLLLGVISSIPVQRKIGRVKNGPLTNTVAYLAGTAVTVANNDPVTIAAKGFITWRTFPATQGIFWSEDVMLTVSTDDYAYLVRGRVIDKARVLAYAVFVQEVNDEIPSVPVTGLVDPGFAASLSSKVEAYLNENMTAFGNITGCSCFIDPAQNVVSTGILNVALDVDAVGYGQTINIKLGFAL